MTIDQVRAYWDRRPCNLRHSAAPLGSRQYFDEVRARKYFVEPHLPAFADFPRWTNKNVLEVGCGMGTVAIDFARAGANIFAIDLSPRAIDLAQLQSTAYAVPIPWGCGNYEELTHVWEGQFHLIFSWGVLHHTPNPDAALRNMHRMLRPDGELRLMLYHRYTPKTLLIALGLAQSEAQRGVPIARTYSRHTARALIVRHGFTITDIHVDHIFPWRVRDYVQYRYVKALPWRILPPALFRALEHRFGQHLLITARRSQP
ncbi:MAG: methyltransferase domain-containing protein [bacterium]